jgi:hypothetical protein
MHLSKAQIPHVRFASLDSIRIDRDRMHVLTVTKAALLQLVARLMRGIAACAREGSFNRRAVLPSASFVSLGRAKSVKLQRCA